MTTRWQLRPIAAPDHHHLGFEVDVVGAPGRPVAQFFVLDTPDGRKAAQKLGAASQLFEAAQTVSEQIGEIGDELFEAVQDARRPL
jgi:hypothetical protein